MQKRLFALGLVFLFSLAAPAEGSSRRVDRRVRIATNVFANVMKSPSSLPAYVLDRAQCIAAVRSVKAGFLFGGEGSVGLVTCRVGDDWSLPSFLNIGGPNVGLQIGISRSEVVLAFMDANAKEMLTRPSIQLGLDLGFALGPVGNGTGSGWTPSAPVLTYVQNQGLWIGFKLDALILGQGERGNAEAYGAGVTTGDILSTPSSTASPNVMQEFSSLVRRFDQ